MGRGGVASSTANATLARSKIVSPGALRDDPKNCCEGD